MHLSFPLGRRGVLREGERHRRGGFADGLLAEVSGETFRADADVGGYADASVGTREGALGLASGPILAVHSPATHESKAAEALSLSRHPGRHAITAMLQLQGVKAGVAVLP